MPAAKIAIPMKERTLRQLDRLVKEKAYRTRSEAIEKAVEEKLGRLERSRLARECAKLSERPIVIVSENIFNQRSGTVIGMALTSQEPRATLLSSARALCWGTPAEKISLI